MQSVAQGWLVLKLTNSALMLGVVSFAGYLPVLLVSLFAGVIVDHVDRRRLIVTTQIAADAERVHPGRADLDRHGAGRVRDHTGRVQRPGDGSFDMPARQTFVVEMVGREDFPNAIALNSMIFNGARVIGPAVAGVLISVIGIAGCFSSTGSAILRSSSACSRWSWWRAICRVLARQCSSACARVSSTSGIISASFYLLLLIAINAGFGMQYSVLIPVFARDILHGGASAYGFLLAAQGVGALLGGVVLASSRTPRGLRQNLIFGLFGSAAGIFVFGFSSVMWLSLLAQMLIGAGLLNYMATNNTMLQLFVSDELRGRVMSMYTLSFIGLAPIGSLEVGYIGERLSPQIAVAASAVAALVCGVILLARLSVIAEAQAARDRAA